MSEARIPVQVDCVAASDGEQVPSRLWFGARLVAVTTVVDRWLAPGHRYFKVKGDDHDTYLVRHDVPTNSWELILYEAGPSRPRSAA